jgi:hypothetical protein
MATRTQSRVSNGKHIGDGALLVPKRRGRPPKVVAPPELEPEEEEEDAEVQPTVVARRGARKVPTGPWDNRLPTTKEKQFKPAVQVNAELRDLDIPTTVLKEKKGKGDKIVGISPPRFEVARATIRGTTPLVLHKFSQKVQDTIRLTQEAGSQSKKGKTRQARDFDDNYENARHKSVQGWDGIPSSAFRNALISACRTVGFKMTIAKMSLFVVADGFDDSGTGLVRITKGSPRMDVRPGRNANGGIDLRARPMWDAQWEAKVTLRWDGDQFSATDVFNLLMRAGQQVGVGEGRPDSKMSAGCGWGEFEVLPSVSYVEGEDFHKLATGKKALRQAG